MKSGTRSKGSARYPTTTPSSSLCRRGTRGSARRRLTRAMQSGTKRATSPAPPPRPPTISAPTSPAYTIRTHAAAATSQCKEDVTSAAPRERDAYHHKARVTEDRGPAPCRPAAAARASPISRSPAARGLRARPRPVARVGQVVARHAGVRTVTQPFVDHLLAEQRRALPEPGDAVDDVDHEVE